MTTESFIEYLKLKLFKNNTSLYQQVKIDDWIYKPGLPGNCHKVNSPKLKETEQAARLYKHPDQIHPNKWVTQQWQYFIRSLPTDIHASEMAALDQKFHFSTSGNSEILCDWFQLAVKANYEVAYPYIEKYLCSVGRRKFVEPIYQCMIENPKTIVLSKKIYSKAKASYHTVTRATIDQMMEKK